MKTSAIPSLALLAALALGARRIVTGDRPPAEYFYSDDHYRSFRRFSGAAR